MKAVITAGGKGTRLSSIATDIPKPMVSINGKPILEHQINCLKANDIKDIIIIVGHLGNVIKEYFDNGERFGVSIEYIEENEPLGSAGSLFYLRTRIKEDFIFIFGDLMLDIDFSRMVDFHFKNNAVITLLSHPNSHPFDSDLIISNKNNLVVGIDSKNNIRDYFYHNVVNSGVYVISSKIFESYFLNPQKTDFEKDILKPEIQNKTVFSYHSTEYVKDAGTPDRYFSVCEDEKNGIIKQKNLSRPQKCIFLDRDGTINKYVGFLTNIDDVCLEDNVANAIKYINKSGYLAIVITNQPVIARGDVTVEELNQIHKKIETLLGKEGAFYDDLFYCPHHPDKGFEGEIPELKIDCDCRKPKIGLISKAKDCYNIDLGNSYFVGDSTVDIQTGINAGLKTILVKTGVKGTDGKYNVKPDYEIDSLIDIKNIIGGEKC